MPLEKQYSDIFEQRYAWQLSKSDKERSIFCRDCLSKHERLELLSGVTVGVDVGVNNIKSVRFAPFLKHQDF